VAVPVLVVVCSGAAPLALAVVGEDVHVDHLFPPGEPLAMISPRE
jgi:hypothetical protein